MRPGYTEDFHFHTLADLRDWLDDFTNLSPLDLATVYFENHAGNARLTFTWKETELTDGSIVKDVVVSTGTAELKARNAVEVSAAFERGNDHGKAMERDRIATALGLYIRE